MINAKDLKSLHRKPVLVISSRDIRHPPVPMKGTIEVREVGRGATLVNLLVEFAQLFRTPAHRRTIALDGSGIARLLESEQNGIFQFIIDEELM